MDRYSSASVHSARMIAGVALTVFFSCYAGIATGDELGELKAILEAQREMIESQAGTIGDLQKRVEEIESDQRDAVMSTLAPGSDEIIRRGDFPKSIKIPDTDVSLAFGGYVRLDAVHDTSQVGSGIFFFPDTIFVNGFERSKTTLSAEQTRFNIMAKKPTPLGQMTGYIEVDFFGNVPSPIEKNDFRMRHAYGEIGPFLAGHTWSTFMDLSAFPRTFTNLGQAGAIFRRLSMLRWTQAFNESWRAQFAIEEPESDVVVPMGARVIEKYPNFVMSMRFSGPSREHVQLGVLLRRLGAEDSSGDDHFVTGWGVNLTGAVPVGRDRLSLGVVFGDGAGVFLAGSAVSPTGARLSAMGEIEALSQHGGFAGFQHWWNDQLYTTVSYSNAKFEGASGLPGSSLKNTLNKSANLIWSPLPSLKFAIEYIYGKRKNQDGQDAAVHRVQTGVQYGF